MPVDVMRETLRRFDRHRRPATDLRAGRQSRAAAFNSPLQIRLCRKRWRRRIDAIVGRAGPLDDTAPPALPHHAGELLRGRRDDALPGIPFRRRSPELRTSTLLAQRWHRLRADACTASPPCSGRTRAACRSSCCASHKVNGAVSKRFSSGTFPFSKFGGTCPLLERAFDPFDTYLTACSAGDRAARRHAVTSRSRADGNAGQGDALYPQPATTHRHRLSCEIRHASKLVFADRNGSRKSRSTPIGFNRRQWDR